jgi:hypothetical protein
VNRSALPQSVSKGNKMKKSFPKSGSKLKGMGAKKGAGGKGKVPPKPSPDMMAPPMPFRKGGSVKGKC